MENGLNFYSFELEFVEKNRRVIYNKKKEKGENKKYMSEVKWTKEQIQAIQEGGSNILVAAAARKR